MFYLKFTREVATMREGGRLLSEIMEQLGEAVRPGVTTAELDGFADDLINGVGAIPSARGYRGFPAAICTSSNDVVAHGIPDETVLREGDNVSLDVAMLYHGYHVDMARTFAVGTASAQIRQTHRRDREIPHGGNQGVPTRGSRR